MEHKANPRNVRRLSDFFPRTNSYLMSKISEGCYSDSPSARLIAQAAIKTVRQQLLEFNAELQKREQRTNSHDLQEIAYALEELDNFMNNRPSDLNAKSGYIFSFYVRHKLADMARLAAEIDCQHISNELPKTIDDFEIEAAL